MISNLLYLASRKSPKSRKDTQNKHENYAYYCNRNCDHMESFYNYSFISFQYMALLVDRIDLEAVRGLVAVYFSGLLTLII